MHALASGRGVEFARALRRSSGEFRGHALPAPRIRIRVLPPLCHLTAFRAAGATTRSALSSAPAPRPARVSAILPCGLN